MFFIEKKPLIKPPQTVFLYFSVPVKRGLPTVLDADKIAKTDADLEKLGINTLKGRRPLRPLCRPRSLGVPVNPLSSSLMSPQ